MRRELLYSMLAAAAFPAVANADAVVKDAVGIQNWQGDSSSKTNDEGTLFVSPNGAEITTSSTTLVAGTYKVTISGIDQTNGKVTVTVGDKTAEPDADGTATVEFTITSETQVTIKVAIEATGENKSFSVGATKVTLVNDEALQAKVAQIQQKLTAATNDIKGWDGFAEADANTYLTRAAQIQSNLAAIQNDEDDSQYLGGYDLYKQYKLYEAVGDDNQFFTEISKVLADATTAYTSQLNALLTAVTSGEAYTKLQTAYEAAANKADYTADWNALQKLISDYKVNLDTNSAQSYYEGLIANINTAITNLQKRIDDDIAAAQAAEKANDTAYNTLKANFAGVKATANSYLTSFAETLASDTLAVSKSLNGYGKLQTAGRSKVVAFLTALASNTLEQDIEASHTAKTSVADQAAQQGKIDDLNKQLADINTLYTSTLKGVLDQLNDTYEAQYAYIPAADEAYPDVIKNYGTERTALVNAVQAVYNAIDAALDKAVNGDDGAALQALDLTTLTAAVTTANNNLTAKADPAQKLFTAKAGATTEVNNLNTKLAEAQAKVKDLKYGDKAAESNYWKTWASGITTTINNTIKNPANNAKTASDNVFQNLSTLVSTVETLISNYETESKAAADNFNVVDSVIAKAETDVAAAKAKVEGLQIYTDNSNSSVDSTYDYKAQIAAAETEVKAIRAELDSALAKKDEENALAVAAVAYDYEASTAKAVVDYVSTNADKDQAAWQANADAEALAAQKAAVQATVTTLSALKNEIAGYIADTENKPLGNATDSIAAEFKEITKDWDDDKISAAIQDDATAAQFNPILELVDTVNAKLTTFNTEKVQPALKRVTENKAAKVTADADIAGLPWTSAKDDIIANAGDAYDKGAIADKNEKAIIDGLVTDIQTAYDAAKAAVDSSYAAETLKADYESAIKAQIAAVQTQIDNAKESATKLKANYEAWQRQIAEQGKLAQTIADAQAAAIAADSVAGDTYYAQKLLAVDYTGRANNILTDITTNYNGQKSVATEANVNSSIETLNSDIAAVKAQAEKNLASYNNLTAKEEEVQETWTAQSIKLEAAVVTSETANTKKTLNGYFDDLTAQIKADKTAYEAGQAESKETDYTAALDIIKKNINDLVDVATADSTINKLVAQANADVMKDITSAYNKAYEAFTKAVGTVDSYKNLSSKGAQTALEAINTEYNTFNSYLYDNAANALANEYKAAQTEYNGIKLPAYFDTEGKYVADFNQLAKDIAAKETEFKATVSKALSDAVDGADGVLKTYDSDIADAEKTIKDTYTLKETKANTDSLDALKGKVADARTYIKSSDVLALDKLLADLDANFDTYLTAALDRAATTNLEGYIAAAEKNVTTGRKYFETNSAKLTADGLPTLEEYNATVAATVEAARTRLTDDVHNSEEYAELKQLIADYNSTNEYKTAAYQLTRVEAIERQMNSTAQQFSGYPKLDCGTTVTQYPTFGEGTIPTYPRIGIENAKAYAVYNELKTMDGGIDDLYEQLTQYAATLKEAKETRNYALVEPNGKTGEFIDLIKANVNTKLLKLLSTSKWDKTLFTKEKAYLDNRLAELTAAYNVWAADTANAAAAPAELATIDAIKERVSKASTATKLLPEEDSIKVAMAKFVPQADADLAKSELKDSLGNVKTSFDEGLLDEVTAQYQSQLDAINAEVAEITAEIDGDADIVFDKDKINTKIDDLVKRSEALAEEVAQANEQRVQDIQNEATAEADQQDAVDNLTAQVTASREKLDAYTAPKANAGMFEAKYKLATDKIAEVQQAVTAYKEDGTAYENNDDVNALVADAQDYLYNDGNTGILDQIENTAAYRQAGYVVDSLETSYKALAEKVNGLDADLYLKSELDQILADTVEVYNDIEGLKTAVESDYNQYVSDDNLAARLETVSEIQEKISSIYAAIKANVTTAAEDVNGDGRVNMQDLYAVINQINGTETGYNCDANNDGRVNMQDVYAIINAINKAVSNK